ncbi:MAG: NAD-dependent epimerase/dehydratase family protein [Flavobacterium sp.]
MILVTGGTGLVGAHLLLKLAEGLIPIRAAYRDQKRIAATRNLFVHNGRQELFERIEWVKADVTDVPQLEDAFKGITHVYHCAALISYDPADEHQLHKINIEGTANMVNCALAFGVQKFCHVSSIAALGDLKPGETIITEDTEWNPERDHSDYAITKHGAEMEVWRAREEGLKTVIVNPGLIFGHGFWKQGSSQILQSVKKGQQFYTKGLYGIIAVEDVVEIMTSLMDNDFEGQRYVLVAENIFCDALLNTIADGMHKKRPYIYATMAMTSFAWRVDWLLSKLLMRKRRFTRDIARSSHNTDTFDNSKIKNALGYDFTDMKPYLQKLAATSIG